MACGQKERAGALLSDRVLEGRQVRRLHLVVLGIVVNFADKALLR